jgi:hypothetical protein
MIEIDGDVARIADVASCVGGLSCVPLIAGQVQAQNKRSLLCG